MSAAERLDKKLKIVLVALVFAACAVPLALLAQGKEQVPRRKVAVIPLSGEVDWHMLATSKRRVGEAKKWGAKHLIFEINSYGGYLDAVEDIADVIVNTQAETQARTTAFIVNKALSGGAYVAMACDDIAMQPHASFGDVMPILPTLQEMPEDYKEKSRSPVRSRFAEYATQHSYPVALAKAMVDPEVEVVRVVLAGPEGQETYYEEKHKVEEWLRRKTEAEGYELVSREVVIEKGKLLTMGSTQAREYGFSKYTVATRIELLNKLAETYYTDMTGEVKSVQYGEVFDVDVFNTNWWEAFIGFLTSPIVKVVLLFVGLLGLYVEFKVPGFGLPGIVGIVCISLVLFASYAVGLASVIELLMIGAGLILLALEVFVIPGFGVAGIAGLVLLLFGVLLSFQKGILPKTPFETSVLQENIVVLATSFIVFAVAAVLLARYLPKTKQFSKIALDGPEAGTVHGDAAVQARLGDLVGKTGTAVTTLRPAGKAKIQGQLVDVVTQGEFLEKEISIRVLRVEGNRIIVIPDTGSES